MLKFIIILQTFYRNEDENTLTYHITMKNMKLSEFFKLIEELKVLGAEKYSVVENSVIENFVNSLTY